jgi:hypothetical protein
MRVRTILLCRVNSLAISLRAGNGPGADHVIGLRALQAIGGYSGLLLQGGGIIQKAFPARP